MRRSLSKAGTRLARSNPLRTPAPADAPAAGPPELPRCRFCRKPAEFAVDHPFVDAPLHVCGACRDEYRDAGRRHRIEMVFTPVASPSIRVRIADAQCVDLTLPGEE